MNIVRVCVVGNKEKAIRESIKYYYKNRKEVLKKQNVRMMKKYHSDPEFKRIYNIRRTTAKNHPRKGQKCEKCGTGEDLQRHHLRYTTRREDFMFLCRKCHNGIHKDE